MRFSKDTKQFILDMMAEGLDISEVAAKYPDKVPPPSQIYKQTIVDDEFAVQINQAYTILLMHRMDELHRIAGQTASQAYPEVGDWRQAEAVLKRRMDEAKFVLGKLAPVLSDRFNKVEKLEVSGDIKNTQVVIMDYSNAKIEKDVSPAIEHKSSNLNE